MLIRMEIYKAAFDGNVCEQTCFKQKFKMQ